MKRKRVNIIADESVSLRKKIEAFASANLVPIASFKTVLNFNQPNHSEIF